MGPHFVYAKLPSYPPTRKYTLPRKYAGGKRCKEASLIQDVIKQVEIFQIVPPKVETIYIEFPHRHNKEIKTKTNK